MRKHYQNLPRSVGPILVISYFRINIASVSLHRHRASIDQRLWYIFQEWSEWWGDLTWPKCTNQPTYLPTYNPTYLPPFENTLSDPRDLCPIKHLLNEVDMTWPRNQPTFPHHHCSHWKYLRCYNLSLLPFLKRKTMAKLLCQLVNSDLMWYSNFQTQPLLRSNFLDLPSRLKMFLNIIITDFQDALPDRCPWSTHCWRSYIYKDTWFGP